MSSHSHLGPVQPPKPPKPEKPVLPFLRFCAAEGAASLAAADVNGVLGARWKALGSQEKEQYTKAYERDRDLYLQALQDYHNSDAYRLWLSHVRSADSSHTSKAPDDVQERERINKAKADRINVKDQASIVRAQAEDAFEAAVKAPEIGGEPPEYECFHEDELITARIARNQAYLEAVFDAGSGSDVANWEDTLSAEEIATLVAELQTETEAVKKETGEMEAKHNDLLGTLRQKRKDFEGKFAHVSQARQFDQLLSEQFPVVTRRRDLEDQPTEGLHARDATFLKL